MTVFNCKLRSLSDLIKLVVYSNPKTNIHIIHCKSRYIDASFHRTFFVYYGGGREYYYCNDPIDGLSEGIYEIDYVKNEIGVCNAERIESFVSCSYDASKLYIIIIGVDDVNFE